MRRAVFAFAVAAGFAGPAWADNKTDAAAAYSEGQKKFVGKDFAGAAKLFVEAYRLDPDPAYLFNIAQAYRLAQQCAEASTYYQQFLATVPEAPNATSVRGHIQEMDTCAKEQAAKAAPPPPPDEIAPVPEPPPPPETGNGRRNVAIGLFGASAVALVGGVLFQRDVSKAEDERASLCAEDLAGTGVCVWDADKETREQELEDRGKRSATLSVVAFSVSGAALVGGIVLLATRRDARDEHALRIVPTTNGALVRWSF